MEDKDAAVMPLSTAMEDLVCFSMQDRIMDIIYMI